MDIYTLQVKKLWDLSKQAEIELLKSLGMKPCGPKGDEDGWWYLPDEDDDGVAYERREACRLHLADVKLTSGS